VSRKCLFWNPEDGLRMGCLGSEPDMRQGVCGARAEQMSEAGKKELCFGLLERTLTVNGTLFK